MENKEKEKVIVLDGGSTNWVMDVLSRLSKEKGYPYSYEIYPIASTNKETLETCIQYVQSQGKHCVLSLTEETVLAQCFVNERLGYPCPSVLSTVYCLNKLLTRSLINDFKWFSGFNLDDDIEEIVKKVIAYPCMLKPTMLYLGLGAFRCNDEAALRANWRKVKDNLQLCTQVIEKHTELVSILTSIGNTDLAGKCTQYMVEEFIETQDCETYQYCMEAYVTKDGKVIPYSLVEEILFKNGMLLTDITPPYHFDGNFKPFEDYIVEIGKKLYGLGFRNQSFNIEFWQFSDGSFRLIEINPRNSFSYWYIFKTFSDNDLFHDVADLFLRNKLPTKTPITESKRQWSLCQGEDMQHAAGVSLTTLARGKRSDLFDYDYLKKLSKDGVRIHYVDSEDSIIADADITMNGGSTAQVTLKGSWKEVVAGARNLRERFYKDMSNCVEASLYPDCFVLSSVDHLLN